MNRHEHYMQIALELAKKGLESVSPNPMVGCVIVKNDQIIGQGYHQKYGEAHAEPNAAASVENQKDIEGSDFYVTLEPCAHYGKTPPCADLLVKLKPKRVIIANVDSNPLVGGKGILKLKNAGIEVITGVLDKEARILNKRFFTVMEKKRPYVILKWAQSKNGFIAGENFEQIQISGKESMHFSHQLRAQEDAILVGFNTAFHDNPSLTTRLVEGKNPLRLYIDKQLKLPKTHHLLDQRAATICFNSVKTETTEHLTFIKLEGENFQNQILDYLFQNKINSLIVEGGTTLLQSFIDKNLWDEALVLESEKKLNKGIKAPEINKKAQEQVSLGDDILISYKA